MSLRSVEEERNIYINLITLCINEKNRINVPKENGEFMENISDMRKDQTRITLKGTDLSTIVKFSWNSIEEKAILPSK